MIEVGSQSGQVHSEKQGTGLATILQGDRALAAMDEWEKLKFGERQKRAAEKDAALGEMLKYNPQYWGKHATEMQGALNGLRDQFIDLQRKGIQNPFSGTDPASQAFQHQFVHVNAMAQTSKQLEGQFNADQTELRGKNPDDFDENSIIAKDQFYKQSLGDIVKSGGQPPVLQSKRPLLDEMNFWTPRWSVLESQHQSGPILDKDKKEFVQGTLAEPDAAKKAMTTASAWLAQQSPAQQQAFQQKAQQNGLSVVEQWGLDSFDRYQKGKAPFDVDGSLNKVANQVKVTTQSFSGPNGGYTKEKIPQAQSSLRAQIDTALSGDEAWKWMSDPQMLQNVPRDKGDNDAEYKAKVKKWMFDKAWPLVSRANTGSSVSDKGEGEKKLKDSGDLWYKTLIYGTPTNQKEAANFLIGGKNLEGWNVQETDLSNAGLAGTNQFTQNKENPFQGDFSGRPRTIKLTVVSNVSAVKGDGSAPDFDPSALPDGSNVTDISTQADYDAKQVRKVVEIPLGALEGTENRMKNIYSKTAKQHDRYFELPKTPSFQQFQSQQAPTSSQPASGWPTFK